MLQYVIWGAGQHLFLIEIRRFKFLLLRVFYGYCEMILKCHPQLLVYLQNIGRLLPPDFSILTSLGFLFPRV